MKSKIKLLFTIFLCCISSVIIAQSVNISTAKAIAENHLKAIRKPSLKSTSIKGNNIHFTSVKVAVENKDTLYYILNDTINKGFVIVSADKRAWPILGYSTTGCFDEIKQPEAFTAWMENRKKEIESIKLNNLQPDKATVASWQNLSILSSASATTSVEPLIQTQWSQGCYYNSLCPVDAAGPCGHANTGCTITAMAQIMKYWNYPTKGIGSHSYSHPTYGILSADFGSTTYQWSQMPNKVTSQNDAVATLMYHCGVSLDTEYGPGASGAWDPRDELVQYFNYSSNAMLVNRNGFPTSEWIKLLKSDLDLGHPIWYTGGSSFAHSFICDGYQDANYFHFNWGWGGSSDGYFYIENLNPGWYDFSENQFALINLVPGDLPDGYNGFFLSSNVVDISTKGGTTSVDVCSSGNWIASSDQSWLSLSTNTGVSGKTTLTLTAIENQTGSDRSDTVTISSPGFGDQIIIVYQLAAVSVTPGSLYRSISEKATSITKLTLTGTIDARDFKTMRDAMPALTDVDLSDVTIVAYTGYEGTANEKKTYPANEIPSASFYIIPCQGQNLLKSVILPATIKSIGSNAFGHCKYLTSINIPSSVTSISTHAFYPCTAFINIDTNNPNYSSIDGVLFNKSQTTIIQCPVSKTGNYSIPSSVTSIGELAFDACIKLTTVTIPLSVTNIEIYAFMNCSGLTNIFIPSTVNNIREEAFRNCSALINVDANNPNYSSIEGILFNKSLTKLIQYPTSKEGKYSIPAFVKTIGRYAFTGCNGLTEINIPSSVYSIELCAFSSCNGLKKVTIPSSITTIEYGTFNSCEELRSVIIPSSVISIVNDAFYDCIKLDSIFVYSISPINMSSSPTIFNNVNRNHCLLFVPFGSKASYQVASQWKDFTNIVEMAGIFLSSNISGISAKTGAAMIIISSSSNWTATSDQTWLTISPTEGITGSDTITFTASENPTTASRTATVTISATGLASQTIKVTQYGMVEVTAGNLKTILEGQLSAITSLSLTGTIDARDFKTMRDEMPKLTDIDLSNTTIAAYSGSEGPGETWTKYYKANGIPNYSFSTPISQQGKTTLYSIILPESVSSIGNCAFKNCVGLKNINIPPMITSIGEEAFTKCTLIESIYIPSSVTFLGDKVFNQFNGLINVDTNNNKYSSIDGILFNKSQTELIKCPMSKTGSYVIPVSITSIAPNAFIYCSGLTNIILPPSLTLINYDTFFYCKGITSIDIPISVTDIGIYAFSECSNLRSVTIPSSVIYIENYAFMGCTELKSIYIYKKSPPSLDNSIKVFDHVNKTYCTLYVPFGSKTLYATATQWKDFTNIVEMPNQAPVANSGTDQSVKENEQFTLDGSASSDPDNDELTYLWTAPEGITLSSSTASKPTFIAPEVKTDTNFTFSLVVNDGNANSAADTVIITVKNINKVPVANAGVDQTVDEKAIIYLDGSASSDADNDKLTYLWTAPTVITLSSTTDPKPTFTAPEITTDSNYTFTLIVNDGSLISTADTVVITVKNVDKAPYVKNPIQDISVDKGAPDQIIDLKTVFADDDLGDVMNYCVTSNTNDQVVTAKITDSNLTLSFSSQNTGLSEIGITAISNGKEVISKFNVEVKVPAGNDPVVCDQNIMLYPNPTTNKLCIKSETFKYSSIKIINLEGKCLFSEITGFLPEKNIQFELPNGQYLLLLENDNQKKTLRFNVTR